MIKASATRLCEGGGVLGLRYGLRVFAVGCGIQGFVSCAFEVGYGVQGVVSSSYGVGCGVQGLVFRACGVECLRSSVLSVRVGCSVQGQFPVPS